MTTQESTGLRWQCSPSYLSITEMGHHSQSQDWCFRHILRSMVLHRHFGLQVIWEWALSRTCLGVKEAERLFEVWCWELYVNEIFLVNTLHRRWTLDGFPCIFRNEDLELSVTGPIQRSCFHKSRADGYFSTEHFQRACPLVLKEADVERNVWCDKWTITKKKLLK